MYIVDVVAKGVRPEDGSTDATAQVTNKPALVPANDNAQRPITASRSSSTSSVARQRNLWLKRQMDIVLSICLLAMLAPLLVVVALAIKLTSKGPVLFKQTREGLMGKPFTVYKFRSMPMDLSDVSGVKQTIKNDPRVTPLGRILRRTSIDELPQLLNVLEGSMSLVGPRPHVPGMWAGGVLYKDLVPYYDQRLGMLPGITGWAQAQGLRGSTNDPEKAKARVDYDIEYIENFSVALDIKIMLMTVQREFIGGSGH